MKNYAAAVGLALLLGACSQGGESISSPAAAVEPDTAQKMAGTASSVPAQMTSASFASLPDRGDLLAYAHTVPFREGPSTWYRAQVSEAHALRAAVQGKLRMTTPDGQIVDYRYQRHIVHANGNWTWIGTIPGSPVGKAIITFGEHAAFGLFNRPNAQPLELTVRDGVAWIVARDPRGMRGVDQTSRPDFVLPAAAIKQAADAKQSRQSMGTASVQAAASGAPTIDVVLGYTNGFATANGGQSQAVTRLTHLVAVTNDAYASSQLSGQVRLVRTVQVTYPDNTANSTALNELSGTNGTSNVTIPASLLPLRNARDQYGGDLVSLVRKFNDPENDGCGIAWLIGGGGTSFTTADAPWGYSVVSDGSDGGYFCRTETLAHELGHNMGQNHNIEDSGGDSGVHPYSYGYRETSATGFFTIMAYRQGDNQYAIPNFANPNISVDGRPTGVANTADNVRSMMQTLPTVAAFRAAVVPQGDRSHDFNGDGVSDMLWRNASYGRNSIWRSGNSANPQAVATVASQAWKVAGIADFNSDGVSDLLWRNNSDGRNSIWLSANSSTPRSISTVTSQAWKIVGVGDFNGDDVSDVLWRNSSDGRNSIWLSANSSTPRAVSTVTSQSWQIAGVGDFNGDGVSDLLWRNSSDGRNSIWLSANSATPRSVSTVASQAWKIGGIGDFNGDGISDLLWRNDSDGRNSIWLSANVATFRAVSPVTTQAWQIAGVGDFNGDGTSDLAWRNHSDGRNSIWLSANSATVQSVSTVGDTAWHLIW